MDSIDHYLILLLAIVSGYGMGLTFCADLNKYFIKHDLLSHRVRAAIHISQWVPALHLILLLLLGPIYFWHNAMMKTKNKASTYQ